MAAPDPGGGRLVNARLAFFYGAVFALIGLHVPFWPVWLAAHGLGPGEIGVLLAVGVGTKIVFNPLVAHLADRRGQRRPIMIALAAAALAAFSLFGLADGFWPILAVTVLFFAAWSPIMPLGESLAMLAGRARAGAGELDYGRVRAWGSLTFIVAAVGGGYALTGRPADVVYWAVLATLVMAIVATTQLPPTAAPAADSARFQPFEVLRGRRFRLFIAAAALIQASHSVYYAFGTLHWKAAGHSEAVIGWLWAEGVVAEIALFAVGQRLVQRFGPERLIALGALAGVLRWAVTGTTDALAGLVVVQALHAFTFGATHLGAIYFITRHMPASASASAQSVYSAVVMGLGIGLTAMLAGTLYGEYGGGAYLAMAVMAAAGLAAAWALVRGRRPGPAFEA